MTDPVLAGIAALPPVGLEEVEATAPRQTRVECKYLLTSEQTGSLFDRIQGRAAALDIDGRRQFAYESVYFDTSGLRSYLDAARSRPRRFKVRTRTYGDGGSCVVEVKLRDSRDQTVKHRRAHPLGEADVLTAEAREFLEGFALVRPWVHDLCPALVTRYRRATLLAGATRVTLDTELRCLSRPGRLGAHRSARLDGLVVVETKRDVAASDVDRMLWAMGARPAAFSKYGVGMAVLDRRLPCNKWHRSLTRAPWVVDTSLSYTSLS